MTRRRVAEAWGLLVEDGDAYGKLEDEVKSVFHGDARMARFLWKSIPALRTAYKKKTSVYRAPPSGPVFAKNWIPFPKNIQDPAPGKL